MIKIEIQSEKIGKRWYAVWVYDRKQFAEVEATRHDGSVWTNYQTTWTLTGFGCRKYRKEIVAYLNKEYGADNKLRKRNVNEEKKRLYETVKEKREKEMRDV